MLTFPEAALIGLMQGAFELFPVSSLGHSVLIPAVVGGRWARDLSVSAPESPYLAFIVGLHVATAAALVLYFRADWVRLARGLVTSIARRQLTDPYQRLAWLLVLGTIPVGLAGLALEHTFRTVLSRPVPTALFLAANGVLLILGQRFVTRRAAPRRDERDEHDELREHGEHGEHGERALGERSDRRLGSLGVPRAVLIGAAQILALAPGISRSGVTILGGMAAGLREADAARFAFLLATPVIAAAGVLKLPDLAGPLGAGIRGQVLLGSVLSFVAAYASVAFLTRYFRTRTLYPFGAYCLVAALASLAVFAAR